ncbi:MAG: hypothetical protein JNK26_01150 [Candidatus Doudnabacteria bacterium]|nr:hypothetical protein [Candidatus Doudnabacteria bacterium]
MRLTTHEKQLVALLLIILAGVSSLVLIVTQINSLVRNIEETNAQIVEENLRRVKYQNLRSNYETILSEVNELKLNSLLPTTANFVKVVEEIEEIAALTQNQIVIRLGDTRLSKEGFELPAGTSNIPKSTTDASNGLSYIEIEVTTRGNFANAVQFTTMLQRSRYFMNINAMRLNRVVSDGDARVDTYFSIRVYVQNVIVR